MKKAIDFLRNKGLEVSNCGLIENNSIDGIEAILLIDELEEATMCDDYCYTIVMDKITKIEI